MARSHIGIAIGTGIGGWGGTTRIASSAVSEIRTRVNSQTLVEPDVSAMNDRKWDLTESAIPASRAARTLASSTDSNRQVEHPSDMSLGP